MSDQKFKRGNLVHITKDLGPYMSHFKKDMDVIIEYSYAEKYGGEDTKSYSVIFPENGKTSAWYLESQLTLINEGGEHLIEKANTKRMEYELKCKDLTYILPNLETEKLNSISILHLFDIFGFRSSFFDNGEFYVLYMEWDMIKPYLIYIKYSKTIEEALSIFTPEALKKYNIENTYKLFKEAEKATTGGVSNDILE